MRQLITKILASNHNANPTDQHKLRRNVKELCKRGKVGNIEVYGVQQETIVNKVDRSV